MTQEEFRNEVRRIRPQLLQTARRYVEIDDAEDMVQDVLLRLWQMLDELHLPLRGLATVLVRNRCIDSLRRHSSPLPEKWKQASESMDLAVSEREEETERLERMMTIIENMPPMQQTILRLRHMEGMEMSDIANLVGSNEVAIRKALSRARQAVKQQYLKKYEQ